jgi:ketosteroid isomerase-like protein
MFDSFEASVPGEIDDELIREIVDPELQLLDFPDIPDRRSYQGHEGMREFLSDLAENWKDTRIELDEIRELDGGAVVALGTLSNVGAMTDVPVSSSIGEVFEFDGERIVRIRMFRDHATALEAAGA